MRRNGRARARQKLCEQLRASQPLAQQEAAAKATAMWAALKDGTAAALAPWAGDPGWVDWRSGGASRSTFLHLAPALSTNAPAILAFLLTQGLAVDVRDHNGCTPLLRCWGVPAAHREPWVEALRAAGADLRATDATGCSVWARVLGGKDPRWADQLTALGIEPTVADLSEERLRHISNPHMWQIALTRAGLSGSERTRLFLYACKEKPPGVAHQLLDAGVDLTMLLDGRDALAWACDRSSPDLKLVSRLVELGCDPDRPLPMAMHNGQPVSARTLVKPAQRPAVEAAFARGRAQALEKA